LPKANENAAIAVQLLLDEVQNSRPNKNCIGAGDVAQALLLAFRGFRHREKFPAKWLP